MSLFKGPAGLLLLVFLAVWVLVAEIDAQSPEVKRRYIHFLNQHRDNSNSNTGGRYCNDMMKKRGLTKPNCKVKNSFIHTTDDKIKAVCGNKGEPYGNMRLSCDAFRVTTCDLKGGSTRPPCDYRNDNRPRYIVIACEEGFPVHFDEGKVIINRPNPCRI